MKVTLLCSTCYIEETEPTLTAKSAASISPLLWEGINTYSWALNYTENKYIDRKAASCIYSTVAEHRIGCSDAQFLVMHTFLFSLP